MSEIVESDVLLQPGIFRHLFVELHHRAWVIHLPGYQRGEHVLTVWVLAVFLNQQFDSVLRDGRLPDGRLRLWPGEHHLAAVVLDILLAGGDRPTS